MLSLPEATALAESQARRREIASALLDLARAADAMTARLAKADAEVTRLRAALEGARAEAVAARAGGAAEAATLRDGAVAVAAAWAAYDAWRQRGGPDGYARHCALREAVSTLALLT